MWKWETVGNWLKGWRGLLLVAVGGSPPASPRAPFWLPSVLVALPALLHPRVIRSPTLTARRLSLQGTNGQPSSGGQGNFGSQGHFGAQGQGNPWDLGHSGGSDGSFGANSQGSSGGQGGSGGPYNMGTNVEVK